MSAPASQPPSNSPASSPSVAVVFVTMNVSKFVARALDSVQNQTYPNLRTILVDNGSTDNTVTFVRTHYPWVDVLAEPTNRGFAGGNNIGMRRFAADYYALVNADATIAPDWVSTLVSALESDPTIAVAGGKILYGDTAVIQAAGGIVRDNAVTFHIGDGEVDSGQYNQRRDVDYCMGAAMLIRGSVARTLGYLPEVYYPIYYEETDFCAQVRRAGQRVVYIPEAVAHHDDKKRPNALPLKFVMRYHKHRYLYALRNMITADQRRKFRDAEHAWLMQNTAHTIQIRAFLLYSKLRNWRWLFRRPWLLRT